MLTRHKGDDDTLEGQRKGNSTESGISPEIDILRFEQFHNTDVLCDVNLLYIWV